MKTVAIIGTHKDTRENAPWDDNSIDVWLFNEAGQSPWAKRVSAILQMHIPAVYKNPLNRCDTGHWDWLKQPHDFPIYMIDKDPDVPASSKYPLEEILEALTCEKRMFTCTAAYALALAAYLKYEKILLYGIEMAYEAEYREQREAVAYWVGFLQGRDIQIERHCANELFEHPLYGREGLWVQSDEIYKNRAIAYAAEIKKAEYQVDKTRRKSPEELKKAIVVLGLKSGRKSECERYLTKIKAMIDVSGVAVLDRSELERASNDLLPKINEAKSKAEQAQGANNAKLYYQFLFAASALAGQWHENQDMLKEVV